MVGGLNGLRGAGRWAARRPPRRPRRLQPGEKAGEPPLFARLYDRCLPYTGAFAKRRILLQTLRFFLRVDLGAFWVRLAPVQQLVDEPAVVIGLGILIDAATYVAGGGGASLLCQCGLPLAHAARCLGAERELRRQGFFGLLALGLLLRAGRTWLRWPQIVHSGGIDNGARVVTVYWSGNHGSARRCG